MPKLLERLAARFGYVTTQRVQTVLASHAALNRISKRTFEAGTVSRLTAEFTPVQVSIDTDLISRLRLMRVRSRYLFKNEPYARRFGRQVQKNVIGPAGVQLSIRGSDDDGTALLLSTDEAKVIENRWESWACSPFLSTDARMTWRQVQRAAAIQAATDGETFCRLTLSPDNPFLLSLQFAPADQFDEQFNTNGAATRIRLAVEAEVATGKRVAYWPWPYDPSDGFAIYPRNPGNRVRVPAGELVHWFLPDFVSQTRGIPWLFSAIPQLNMLNGFAEAELVASRISASKMGFFTPPEGGNYTGGKPQDAAGNTISETSPGTFEELPPGTTFTPFDPQHPNANFGTFQKAMLRGTAAAGDLAYHSLSGDLEGVNYSSARIGLLDERAGWEMIQDEFVAGFCQPIFRAWLVAQASLGAIPMSVKDALTFDQIVWRPRRWSWVDPLKEVNAAAIAVGLRIKSRTQICTEMDEEFVSTAAELAAEEEILQEGNIPTTLPGYPPPAPDAPEEGTDEPPPPAPKTSPRGHSGPRRRFPGVR